MTTLLLISDANVLIDIEDGRLSNELFKLPYQFAVPDVLFEEELRKHYAHLLKLGLKKKVLQAKNVAWVFELTIKYRRTSRNDLFALSLAQQEKAILLTGDKPLRNAAQKENIPFHGTIWLIRQMIDAKIITLKQAKVAFEQMKAAGSRLPEDKIKQALSKKP